MFTRKHKNIPQKAPKKLWFRKSFNFTVPQSFEGYCDYIESLDRTLFSSYSVYLSSIDQKRISFTISKSAGKSGQVWAVGYIEAAEMSSTRIVGKAGVPAFTILFDLFALLLPGIIFGLNMYLYSGLDATYIFGFFVALIELLVLGILLWTRMNLLNALAMQE